MQLPFPWRTKHSSECTAVHASVKAKTGEPKNPAWSHLYRLAVNTACLVAGTLTAGDTVTAT